MANLELAAAFGAADAAKEQDLRGYYPMAARVLAEEVRRLKAEQDAVAQENLGAPVGGWRPIETAPEGEDILLWTPSGQLVGYQWKRGLWHASGVKASHEDCDVELFEAPTHWVPKPADPVGQASTLA